MQLCLRVIAIILPFSDNNILCTVQVEVLYNATHSAGYYYQHSHLHWVIIRFYPITTTCKSIRNMQSNIVPSCTQVNVVV